MTDNVASIAVNADLVASCGLYCGACRAHLAGKCAGCRENAKATWCKIRSCCAEKQVATDRYADPYVNTGYGDLPYNQVEYGWTATQRTVAQFTYVPTQDNPSTTPTPGRAEAKDRSFGSAHPMGYNAVMGDGSVQTITYNANYAVLVNLGKRADGAGRSADIQ